MNIYVCVYSFIISLQQWFQYIAEKCCSMPHPSCQIFCLSNVCNNLSGCFSALILNNYFDAWSVRQAYYSFLRAIMVQTRPFDAEEITLEVSVLQTPPNKWGPLISFFHFQNLFFPEGACHVPKAPGGNLRTPPQNQKGWECFSSFLRVFYLRDITERNIHDDSKYDPADMLHSIGLPSLIWPHQKIKCKSISLIGKES